jgi:MFS family permease
MSSALQPASIWTVLQDKPFRGMWSASFGYFTANSMMAMAAAWMMVELQASSFVVALVQTAVFLPMFVLALPAGVMADTTDRRRLLLTTLAVQVGGVAVLSAALLSGVAGAGTVLFFTLLFGCCTAVLTPAWNSMVGEMRPREELPHVILSMSMAYNGARALGPALAGLWFAWLGSAWVFVLASAGVMAMWWAIRRWPPKAHPLSRLPAERVWGGTLAALRYARHSTPMLAQLLRTAAFGGTGSALWAVLPVSGQQSLGLNAEGFGLLMACLGMGAVGVGVFFGALRQRLGLEKLVVGAGLLFALVMLVSALSHSRWLVYAALVLGGGCWMVVMTTYNTATQGSAPPWVRSRASALHVLSALGSFALGSALWGALASLASLPTALCVAAAGVVAGSLLGPLFPLRMGEHKDVTQVIPFEDLLVADTPQPGAGPIAVELSYRIVPGQAAPFLNALSLLKGPRRRDGATFWRIYHDLGDPNRYVERFIVSSWADYLHQRARTTMADKELEDQLLVFLQPGTSVVLQHYIAER